MPILPIEGSIEESNDPADSEVDREVQQAF